MLRFRWPAFELHANIDRPVTATNAYELLTLERELKKLTKSEPTELRIRFPDTLEQTYLKHEVKEQRAGEIGTSQNYLEYLGTAEIAEIFSSKEPDTCTMADVDICPSSCSIARWGALTWCSSNREIAPITKSSRPRF
jgi:hypothetical protein